MYAITEKVLVKFDDLIFMTFSYFGIFNVIEKKLPDAIVQ